MTQTAELRGSHFRPPAKALLGALPANHPLLLVPEPTNPYDPNAIAVYLASATVNQDILSELSDTLPPMGCDVETFLGQPMWHIGYMAKDHAAKHVEEISRLLQSFREEYSSPSSWGEPGFSARLGFSGDGKYVVRFEI